MAQKKIEKGMIFEYIVDFILKRIYPHINFEHTDYSHDGGKDFYATYGGEKLWVEAKCHERHLEISRIAGTFIMADIFTINQIIVFSASKLMEGAIENLSKYATRHGKTMIIFHGDDITELICGNEEIGLEEFLETFSTEYRQAVVQLIEKMQSLMQKKGFSNLRQCLQTIMNEAKEKPHADFVVPVFAFCIYNYVKRNFSTQKKEEVKILNQKYYLQTGKANPSVLEHGVKAFQVFSHEIVIRNENVHQSKKFRIEYALSTKHYRVVSINSILVILQPGQCFAAITYFKALNDTTNFVLPQPKITANEDIIIDSARIYQTFSIPCQIIGETPYLPPDGAKFNSCCGEILRKKVFSPIVVYGKSGTGKTRFLFEMQNKRIEDGNQCFIFRGENPCNSIADLLRYLLLSYYNLEFDTETGKIDLPDYSDADIPESYQFIFNLLNEGKLDSITARNWLVSVLKCGGITLLIDNVQMLDKKIYELFLQVISDLQNHSCSSEIILSFNTDFMPKESAAYIFFTHVKNLVPEKLRVEISGFDEKNAVLYLKHALDPDNLRNDIDVLCAQTVAKVGTNPLFLKQIVHYLHQKEIIDFKGGAICIVNHRELVDALSDLPATIHELLALRYKLLSETLSSQKEQLDDLFWSILLFNAAPENLVQKIDGLQPETLRACLSAGFVKYGENNCLVYDHQLIAKSLLILLEGKDYCPKPEISKIGLRQSTAIAYLDSLGVYEFAIPQFVIREKWLGATEKNVVDLLHYISPESAPELLIPYFIGLIGKKISDYNDRLSAKLKVDALFRIITNCQDKLGVQRTKTLFSGIIKFQMVNFEINRSCTDSFIELMKFFMYELPPHEKKAFLEDMQKIGYRLLSGSINKKKREDYEIWIKWATGKNQMHIYDFKTARELLDQGVQLALQTGNHHRLAELEVQLGYLAAYVGDKTDTQRHWLTAANHFSECGIYDKMLRIIFKGNAQILGNDYSETKRHFADLHTEYIKRDCYAFLKASADDFFSNVLILQAVNSGVYDKSVDEEIQVVLKRFRALALTYDTKVYLHATYKTLVYYKYLLENFSEIRDRAEVERDRALAYILCEELLRNYRWRESDFCFFLPIFKDIAEITGGDKTVCERMTEHVDPEWRQLFCQFTQKNTKTITPLPQAVKGIFSDKHETIHLFHYSYTW